MWKAILLLGSNLGNKTYYLSKALEYLEANKETKIIKKSSIYESEAVGYESSNSYYNLAVEVETTLAPQLLLQFCLDTESKLSRTRSLTERYADRTIDIDIILIDQLIIKEASLTVPHPRMHERLFCLKPVCDIAAVWLIPTLNKTVEQIVLEIQNTSKVTQVNVEI